MNPAGISVVILTYNRPDILAANLRGLAASESLLREIIVVDNSSDERTAVVIQQSFPTVTYLHNEVNTGVAGRNRGLTKASGDVVVTLDDDVLGLELADFQYIAGRFEAEDNLAALCFRVLHYETGQVCNWCHHRAITQYEHESFSTYEISEGAVAYRRASVVAAGCYFEDFFISHEGKDLAYRLMNAGEDVVYDGQVSVIHEHAVAGRSSWRRYYYDTRNAIWLAVRNMPLWYGVRFIALTMCAMGVYSLRDGYLRYWGRAIWDGVRQFRRVVRFRQPWTAQTTARIREIERFHPGFWRVVRQRLFQHKVEI